MSRPDRKRAGFTLLEMVVVLGVIGTIAAMTMPSIVAAVWSQRQASAAQDLVSFLRGVRDMTRRSGVAHNVVFTTDTDELGRLEVWMGMNNRCRLTDWQYAFVGSANRHTPVASFDMWRFNPYTGDDAPEPGGDLDVLALRARTVQFTNAAGVRTTSPVESANLASGELCFEPAGDTYFRTPVINASDTTQVMALQSQLVQFAVVRLRAGSNTESRGVDRHVIVNPSGVARVRR